MKQFTDITVLLDRSGSMQSIKSDMEGAFNTFIKEHRVNPTTRISLIQFDTSDDQEVVYQSVPVNYVENLNLVPRGGTPLIDALVKCIDRTGQRYANLPESERPDQVLFVIITDGEENSSRAYRRQDVFDRVKKQTNDYKWQFVYLGANQDAIAEASSYGMDPNKAIRWFNVNRVASAFIGNTVAYASSKGSARGLTSTADETLNWTAEQREAQKEDE